MSSDSEAGNSAGNARETSAATSAGNAASPAESAHADRSEPGTPVEVTRSGEHLFTASNSRGGRVTIGREGMADSFTPGELLLAAIAGCSGITAENLLVRRLGEEAEITFHADRQKNPADQHKFAAVQVSLRAALEEIDDPAERDKLIDAVGRAIGKYCTVSRSVEESTPVHLDLGPVS